MVLPLVLFTVFGILYLCFHVHNRSWLTAAAGEAALCGSLEGVYENGEAAACASQRAYELLRSGFFAAEVTPEVRTAGSVSVCYQLETRAAVLGFSWRSQALWQSLILHPGDTVRERRLQRKRGDET